MFRITTATKKIKAMCRTTKDGIPPKRIHICQGGTSASKTISIIMYLIALAQADGDRKTLEKFPTLTSIVSESVPHLKRGAIRDFLSIMQQHGYFKQANWNQTDFIYTFETGSKIEFFSSDNGDKLRGARRDRLFINEANNVTFDAFEQLEVRTKDVVFLDYNPTSDFWVKDVKDNRTDWDFVILTYLDNEALSQTIVESIEQRKNRKGWWAVYGLGQPGEVEGKIYKDWAIIDDIPHEARLERYAVDFGYSNDPTAIVAIYKYNGGYILDQILYKKEVSNKMIADAILNSTNSEVLVIADSAEPKSIAELATYSLNVLPCEKGKDSVWNGIQVVQNERISMTKRSVDLISEYRNYLWRTDKDGKILNIPESGKDHALDAVRYGITSMVKEWSYGKLLVHIPEFD
jgi:phage terminase large subunit